MKNLMLLVLSLFFVGCASKEIKRTKFSDKNMRIMVYHEGMPSDEFVRLHSAVIKSNAFSVIDRSRGFQAIKKEQEMIHREDVDRFDDSQKFAHWGKLYGVGAVIVPHIQCNRAFHTWSGGAYQKCYQALNMVDANTGEIIVGVESESPIDLGYSETSDWTDIVYELVEKYPKTFKVEQKHEKLIEYEDLSKEEATRQKEVLAKEMVGR